jgi:beta-glucanase (GH16 family)
MKKIWMLSLIFTSIWILSSCESNLPPNGLKPLKAYDGCEVTQLDGYVCVWADEFNGDTLDTSKWNVEVNGFGGGNNELQFYREENITVSDGHLFITAREEYFGGRNYTSGRINSKYKGEFTYGKAVIAAQVPAGKGTWSAVWMLPTMNTYGGWPHSGEIDILEHVGYDNNRVFGSTHTTKFNHQNTNGALTFSKTLFEATTQLNIYELEWSPGYMMMTVNGERIGEFNYTPAFNQDVPYDDVYPFDQAFHFVLNVAIGGDWGGIQGVDKSIFPAIMKVDYVRFYQLDYAKLDRELPSTPEDIRRMTQLNQGIFWKPSRDDTGVEKYAIYVDGIFFDYTNLNQYTFINRIPFKALVSGKTYQIEIKAIDFTGRESDVSEPFSLTL